MAQGARHYHAHTDVRSQVLSVDQPARVDVFIDYSNMYVGARELFGRLSPHWTSRTGSASARPTGPNPDFGHFDPRTLAELLTSRAAPGIPDRVLGRVHVFRGEPDGARSPELWAHFRRALDRWEADDIHVTSLPCLYRRDAGRMVEKGIDVALSLEAFDRALHRLHEVAVLVSADQDLLPLVRRLADERLPGSVEVAAWAGDGYGRATILGGMGVVEHRLDRSVFEQVRVSNWEQPAVRSEPQPGVS